MFHWNMNEWYFDSIGCAWLWSFSSRVVFFRVPLSLIASLSNSEFMWEEKGSNNKRNNGTHFELYCYHYIYTIWLGLFSPSFVCVCVSVFGRDILSRWQKALNGIIECCLYWNWYGFILSSVFILTQAWLHKQNFLQMIYFGVCVCGLLYTTYGLMYRYCADGSMYTKIVDTKIYSMQPKHMFIFQ